jgi:CRP/FNR family transcriptional regulator
MLMKTLPLYLQDQSHPQAQVCQSCEVRRSALFGALDVTSLERIHAHIAAPALQPGDRVFARGEKAAAVYTVRAGIVRFERVTAAGERRIVRLAGKGDLIGQEALLHQPYTDEAVACTPVQLCRIPASLVDDLGRDHASLLLELMRRWQQALDQAESWMSELAAGAARHRVLRLLALLQRHTNDQGWIWLPRRDEMGAMLGMTVETASRVVSQLKREGVLQLLPPLHAQLDAGRLAHALQQQDLA